jgi:hypothetical protein
MDALFLLPCFLGLSSSESNLTLPIYQAQARCDRNYDVGSQSDDSSGVRGDVV